MSKKNLDKQEAKWFVETLGCPEKWAESFLRDPTDPTKSLSLRSYQKEVLENTRNEKYMVLRYGRRMGKSVVLCADALWWTTAQPLVEMFERGEDRQRPFNVLIVTPMDTQIKMLFDTILQLCEGSPFLQDQIEKIRRSDVNEIKFKNGSKIKGQTIGISTANKGTSARGQNADYLLIDECDYIPKEILEEAILPISTTNENCKVRACSTPSGKREYFWMWCTKADDLGWWHRHYPAWHPDNAGFVTIEEAERRGIPKTQSAEYQWRSTMSSEAYMREYGAEFGEELQGVYKHSAINECVVKYMNVFDASNTDSFNPGFAQNTNNLFIIGVDWNSYRNGGQIVLVEYCAEPTKIEYFDEEGNEDVTINCTNKFRLFYRCGIKSEESTQRKTRQEIIRLMMNYKIDYLYVDYGAGDTNIEELTHYGRQHPELGINRKLRVVDSGSSVEHYDPVLQEKVKKRAKSLMVNTSVITVEEKRIWLPKEEDASHRLVDQMRGYQIKNVTTRGDYTYTGEDHVLDAFNLAIYGFYREYSNLLKSRNEINIRYMSGDLNLSRENAPHRKNEAKSPILMGGTEQKIRDPEAKPSFDAPIFKPFNRYSRGSNSLGSGFRRQL